MVKFPYKVVTVLGDGFGCSLLTMSGVSSPNFITGNVGTGQCPFRGGEILFRLGGVLFLFFLSKVSAVSYLCLFSFVSAGGLLVSLLIIS